MMPEASFERSFCGRTLGMEAVGIVQAVGPNVKVGAAAGAA